jgi:sarcosine oxidase subunit gamma
MVERLARMPPLPASAIGADGVTLSPAPGGARFIFRGPEGAAQAADEAWGTPLSRVACRATMAMGRAALWLGPDEWLLLAPGEEPETVAAQLAARLPGIGHALVDVSHRQTALILSGVLAETVLAGGNPLDLDIGAFPVGMCTRTLLGKSEIVLWRTGRETFHIEVWRSFAPYVWEFLREHMREFGG